MTLIWEQGRLELGLKRGSDSRSDDLEIVVPLENAKDFSCTRAARRDKMGAYYKLKKPSSHELVCQD